MEPDMNQSSFITLTGHCRNTRFQELKRFTFGFVFSLPSSLLALALLILLVHNGVSIFYVRLPFLAKIPPEPASFSAENSAGEITRKLVSSTPSSSSSVMLAVTEEDPPPTLKTRSPILQKLEFSASPPKDLVVHTRKRLRRRKRVFKTLRSDSASEQFPVRVKKLFGGNSSDSSCEVRFFMTWISSLHSFGERELLAVESVFKSHPSACLIIVSNSIDSREGTELLKPFMNRGFRVMAIAPDFDYIFKNTHAELWFNRLKKGSVDPGEVSLGQNLSNLVRIALLYKFGGIYIDTDVLVLRSLKKLRNVIGAQSIDPETRNWSRLNNAVMIFDKKHPLLFKFMEEFSLTFDGNKWGHNGPYLVSRVVSRLAERPGFHFTVLPPFAFYPVDWSRIRSLFRGPSNENHYKWLQLKLKSIRGQSFAVHLWNRQSRSINVEEGSIIGHIMSDCCVFCNSSTSLL